MGVIKMSDFNSFMDRGLYHIETSPFICNGNQWTGRRVLDTPQMRVVLVFETQILKADNFFPS